MKLILYNNFSEINQLNKTISKVGNKICQQNQN